MQDDRLEHTISTIVTEKSRKKVLGIAHEWGIPYSVVMKRLILYLLGGNIDVPSLFKKTRALGTAFPPEKKDGTMLKVTVSCDLYCQLLELAEDWGSKPSRVMGALLELFLTEEIGRRDIW